ncbi:MAG: hypothetical protein WCH11_03260 [Bdellovibrio sp.]
MDFADREYVNEKFWFFLSSASILVSGIFLALLQRPSSCIRSSLVERIDIQGPLRSSRILNCSADQELWVDAQAQEQLLRLQPLVRDLESQLLEMGSFPFQVRLHIGEGSRSPVSPPWEIYLKSDWYSEQLVQKIFLIWVRSRFPDFSNLTHEALSHYLSRRRDLFWFLDPNPRSSHESDLNWMNSVEARSSGEWLSSLLIHSQNQLSFRNRWALREAWRFPSRGVDLRSFLIDDRNASFAEGRNLEIRRSQLRRSFSEIESLCLIERRLRSWCDEIQKVAFRSDVFSESLKSLKWLFVFPEAGADEWEKFRRMPEQEGVPEKLSWAVASVSKWILPPLRTDFSVEDLHRLRAFQAVWFACGSPVLESFQELSSRIENLLWVDACKSPRNINWQVLFRGGVEAFAAAHPELTLMQLHLPSLGSLGRLKYQRPRDLLQQRNVREEMGWHRSYLDSIYSFYRVEANVQAIQFFRFN